MAELTIAALKAAVKTYVDASKQLGAEFTATKDDFTNTICKIGEMKTLYLPQVDKLPELNGANLPFGETIEEFMVNDFLPTTYTFEDGAARKNAKRVTFAEAVYSYPLEEQLFEVGLSRSQFQRVSLGAESYGNLIASSMSTMDSSTNAWNYAAKRQLLGNAATEAAKKAALVSTIAIPNDAETGEAFIKEVKKCVEVAKDMNDGNLAGHVAAAAPSLKLYVKQGVMPSIEVDTMAGAFHEEKLAIPAEIKTVLDFGGADDSIYAILVDERGVKLHDDKNYVDYDHDGRHSVDSYYRHLKQTGFISKYAYIHIFKAN